MLVAVIINPNVHTGSKLNRKQFLGRLSSVEAVRTNVNAYDEGLSVYIHSVETFNYYRHLKDAISNGDFSGLDGTYRVRHFGIDIADPLLKWFESCELSIIQKQVVCWLTALYAMDSSSRHIMEDQIYPPVMQEIRLLFKDFYQEKYPEEQIDKDIRAIYKEACNYYYNSFPPNILDRPGTLQIDQKTVDNWRIHNTFDINIGRFWFRENDWQRIVVDQEEDDMLRSESSKEYYAQWKHQFSSYDSHGAHIYGLYDTEATSGYIYIVCEEATSNYKIGFTTNSDIEKRLGSLQTGNSNQLVVRGSFPCASRKSERLLHAMFSDSRVRGEWFALTEVQVNEILDANWRKDNFVF